MRKLLPCASILFLISMACAEAATAPAEVNGVNLKSEPAAPIPPTPALAPVHKGTVAGTVDSLPAALNEKERELQMIEEQNRVASASPEPEHHEASVSPAAAAKSAQRAVARTGSKTARQKPAQGEFTGM